MNWWDFLIVPGAWFTLREYITWREHKAMRRELEEIKRLLVEPPKG